MVRPVTIIPFLPRYTTRVQAWVYVVSIPAINNVTINNVFISISFDFCIKRMTGVISFPKVIRNDKFIYLIPSKIEIVNIIRTLPDY